MEHDRQPAGARTVDGGRCLACGYVFAPAQAYGCERCGAFGDRIEACALPSDGRIISAATIHVHRYPTPPTPFTLIEVALDAGPVIRVLADGDAADLSAGARAVRGTDGGDGLPRFVAADAGASA